VPGAGAAPGTPIAHATMTPADDTPDELIRHEEALRIETRTIDTGAVRVRKEVSTEHTTTPIPRTLEHADHLERTAAGDEDSGQIETLDDGSISIPLFEEQLVVTKRLVVRERVIVRKVTTTENQVIEADLRSERARIETDDAR
jgi:uncharacterized protein (TIGR02271 family)